MAQQMVCMCVRVYKHLQYSASFAEIQFISKFLQGRKQDEER